MQSNKLKISVVMSVYNHQEYVSDAIESIINQTMPNIEFIIVNDGSIDDSLKIIQKYKRLDSRIVVINQKNKGLTKSLNIAVRRSTGQYIARQDADDTSALNRFEKQLIALKKYNLDIVTSRAIKGIKITPNKFILNFNQNDILKAGNIFIHGTFFLKRKVFDIQKYDEKYRYAQDFKFILDAISNNFRIGYMVDPQYYLNNIESSISNTKGFEQDKYVSKALMSFFGTDKFSLFVNRRTKKFKNICKLMVIIYLFIRYKGKRFDIIK